MAEKPPGEEQGSRGGWRRSHLPGCRHPPTARYLLPIIHAEQCKLQYIFSQNASMFQTLLALHDTHPVYSVCTINPVGTITKNISSFAGVAGQWFYYVLFCMLCPVSPKCTVFYHAHCFISPALFCVLSTVSCPQYAAYCFAPKDGAQYPSRGPPRINATGKRPQ